MYVIRTGAFWYNKIISDTYSGLRRLMSNISEIFFIFVPTFSRFRCEEELRGSGVAAGNGGERRRLVPPGDGARGRGGQPVHQPGGVGEWGAHHLPGTGTVWEMGRRDLLKFRWTQQLFACSLTNRPPVNWFNACFATFIYPDFYLNGYREIL